MAAEPEKEGIVKESSGRTRPEEITTLLNYLHRELRQWKRNKPIAKKYKEVGTKIETGKQNEVLNEIRDLWGCGVSDFIRAEMGRLSEKEKNSCIALFSTAALCAKNPEPKMAQKRQKFLEKWDDIKQKIGLSNNPEEMVGNFPRYHVGNWRQLYFATALEFFQHLPDRTKFLGKEEFLSEYNQQIVAPILDIFREFAEMTKDELWGLIDKKIAHMGEKGPDWYTYLASFREAKDFSKYVPATACIPYFQRCFILSSTEKVSDWGYRLHQSNMVLEKYMYPRAKSMIGPKS